MNKAVFLDRDGTLNKLIFDDSRSVLRPPFSPEELEMNDGVIEALRLLMSGGYLLFVVSNQPDVAKGYADMSDLQSVHSRFAEILAKENIEVKEFFYCYHHPNGIDKEYTFDCECRKPKPYFPNKAIAEYLIDRNNSWFVGDRESDVACGKSAGVRTVFITSGQGNPAKDYGEDLRSPDLKSAVQTILNIKQTQYAVNQ